MTRAPFARTLPRVTSRIADPDSLAYPNRAPDPIGSSQSYIHREPTGEKVRKKVGTHTLTRIDTTTGKIVISKRPTMKMVDEMEVVGRECTDCGWYQPFENPDGTLNFHRDSRATTGFQARCKRCLNERRKDQRRRIQRLVELGVAPGAFEVVRV